MRKKRAEIIPFPPGQRLADVRAIIKTGQRLKTAWQRKRYWQGRMDALRKRLADLGVRPIEIERAVVDLHRAVAAEADRQSRRAEARKIAAQRRQSEAAAAAVEAADG